MDFFNVVVINKTGDIISRRLKVFNSAEEAQRTADSYNRDWNEVIALQNEYGYGYKYSVSTATSETIRLSKEWKL